MSKIICFWSGIVLLVLGLLGFVPTVVPNGYLFGAFYVDPAHNTVYMLSGLLLLLAAGALSEPGVKTCLYVFAVIYLAAAVLGFAYGGRQIFQTITCNLADNWLHLVIGLVLLVGGLSGRHEHIMTNPPATR
ncbi:MAG TPA: DUF4383 domain-containing protein [Verrucomicrobiae bacterium]|nr:DUF4383 domain-containing protein [Verrucomicrobiae bacterium]